MFHFPDRRNSPRSKPQGFATAFGEVVNVSEGGMAVLHRGPKIQPGSTLRVSISWAGDLVRVDCEVKRVKPEGFRRQRVSLSWIQPPAGLVAWLRQAGNGGAECLGPQVYALPAVAA